MSDPVDRVTDLLSRLGPVQGDPRSTWAKARCPAHDDQEPSLTFHLADDGWVLLTCHAGCDRAMVLSALGLSLADIGPPRDEQDAVGKLIEYPYRRLVLTPDDEGNPQAAEGDTVLTVYRPGPNGAKCGRTPAGVPTSQVPLYRIAEVAQAVLGQHPAIDGPCTAVAVCEGEKDAEALWRHVPPIPATCNAGGASKSGQRPKWTPAHADELASVLKLQPGGEDDLPVAVYVLADNDDAGLAHARAVYESLHAKGLPVEAFLPAHHRGIAHYDIADQLGEGHPATDLEQLPFGVLPPDDAVPPMSTYERLIPNEPPEPDPWASAPPRPAPALMEPPEEVATEEEELPPFPVECLPPAVASMVAAVAESSDTDPVMGAMAALGVMATAVAGRLKVHPSWWMAPRQATLYTIALAPPSTRKSPVLSALRQPLKDVEAELRRAALPAVVRSQSERDILTAQIDVAKKLAGKSGSTADSEEAVDLARQLAELPDVHLPEIFITDATPEAMVVVMAEQGGRIAVLDSEATLLAQMGGLYSAQANVMPYLSAYEGEDVSTKRKASADIHCPSAVLAAGLVVQPGPWARLMAKEGTRDQGLIARFLIGWCREYPRRGRTPPLPPWVVDDYNAMASRVLRSYWAMEAPVIATMTPEAEDVFEAFLNDLEPIRLHGWLRVEADWAGKLDGQVARISALLAAWETSEAPPPVIHRQHVDRAVAIVWCIARHAMWALNHRSSIEEQMAETDAERLVQHLERRGGEVTRRSAMRALHWKSSRIASAIIELAEEGRMIEQTRRQAQGPSALYLVLRPAWHRSEKSEKPLDSRPGRDDTEGWKRPDKETR